jgi:UDPglucose--hexose-1-phosphate uridylyltransferase
VAQNEHFLGFTPYASRFPFEAWLLPKRHEANFTCTSKEEMADFARLLKVVLATHSRSLGDPPYNYLLHTKPSWVADGEEGKAVGDFYHWHLEIVPRLMRLVGFESGSGLYLNPTPPEEAAARLREGLV